MSNNYSKAYVEVLEILKYIPREDLEKVPKDIIYKIVQIKSISLKLIKVFLLKNRT